MELRLTFIILMTLIIAAFIGGCGGSGSSGGSKDPSADGSWTVLVYMNADNNLDPDGLLNLNEMELVGSTASVKIVVQLDRSDTGSWTSARRYFVTRDTNVNVIASTLIEDMGEIDMGDPETLRDFIQWGQQNYPSDRYCLVIWNHGSGALPPYRTRDVSFDDSSGNAIRTVDIPYALSAASPKLDVVAFDASLMQMIEVAYEIRENAEILVGSEESPPAEGYPYDKWLSRLIVTPSMTPEALGRTIAQNYVAIRGKSYDVTQSVIRLSEVEDVVRAVDALAQAIIPHAHSDADTLRDCRLDAQNYKYSYYRDLLDYARLVKSRIPDAAIASSFTGLQSALNSAVVYESHKGIALSRSSGLSIYIPAPTDYYPQYAALSMTRDYPNWDIWLQSQER